MKLAIISHTEHYLSKGGSVVGWGPTISELNYLADSFDTIYHIAFLHKATPPPSSLPYTSSNIIFIPLPPSGGRTLMAKLSVLSRLPKTLSIIHKTLKEVDAFQFRTPVGIGVYLIPWLTLFTKKKGWYKYAGNWKQESPPLGYALQRWMLKKQARNVTINGKWSDQPDHCLTFENPCLSLEEREEGKKFILSKSYEGPFSFCFVGRLEDEKGVQRIIDAFGALSSKDRIGTIHFVGNGQKMEHYKEESRRLGVPAVFHGFLSRNEVFDLYRQCRFLLLPSTASEGFPKVIAEGMNYGCIPIVSKVSSIGQYITSDNGYIVNPVNGNQLHTILEGILEEKEVALKEKAVLGYDVASSFTFEHYKERILGEILGLDN